MCVSLPVPVMVRLNPVRLTYAGKTAAQRGTRTPHQCPYRRDKVYQARFDTRIVALTMKAGFCRCRPSDCRLSVQLLVCVCVCVSGNRRCAHRIAVDVARYVGIYVLRARKRSSERIAMALVRSTATARVSELVRQMHLDIDYRKTVRRGRRKTFWTSG